MKLISKTILLICTIIAQGLSQNIYSKDINEKIHKTVKQEIDHAIELCYHLHQNPELSLQEFETSKRMAQELREIGFKVTENAGGNNVVGVFKNGEGPCIMVRTDMDALPIDEKTAFKFASRKTGNNNGVDVPVMHACGHDMHMSSWVGTARSLVALKAEWKGTIIFLAQQAEEIGQGAKAALDYGLFSKFPVPDYILAYHVRPDLVAGTVGIREGAIYAGVKTAEITVYGKGGHGAYPHLCIDPIVISAQIINNLQTIVSRELNPYEPAVVTVGSIHGGTRPNIIPDEVKMELTLRYFSMPSIEKIKTGIDRITKQAALSAGVPQDLLPKVEILPVEVPPLINDAPLCTSIRGYTSDIIGNENIRPIEPVMAGEDFSKYGFTEENIPICLIVLGMTNPALMSELESEGKRPYPLHSANFCPDYPATISTGMTIMTKNIIGLMNDKK